MECSYTHPRFRDTLSRLPLKTMLEIGSLHGLDAIEVMKSYALERVITIECNPDCIEICKRNFAPHPNITLVEVAAWHEDGKIPFYPVVDSVDWNGKPTHNIGASSCFKTNGSWPFEKYTQQKIEVPARRLDGVLDGLGAPAIDLICMDAQGAELYALQGLGRYLDGVRAIVTELELKPMYHEQTLFADVCQFLKQRGFRLAAENRWAETAGDFLFVRETAAPAAAPIRLAAKAARRPVTNEPMFTTEDALNACKIAEAQIAAGRLQAAETILATVLEHFAEFFPALLIQARMCETQSDFTGAIALYERASAVNPGHALPFTRRGILLLRQHVGNPGSPRRLDPARPAVMMSNLGSNGRFGNQLLQYGVLRLYAERLGAQVLVPDWIGRDLFALNDGLPIIAHAGQTIDEAAMLAVVSGRAAQGRTNVDSTGYFCGNTADWAAGRAKFQRWFEPVPKVRTVADACWRKLKTMGRTVVAIHVRRGDFTGGKFWPTPTEWYLAWLKQLWPELPAPVLYLATDDPKVAAEFADYPLVTAEELSAPLPGAEFFIDHWILRHADVLGTSNSTFSITAALLNSRTDHCWRPDRAVAGLRPFDPWAEPVLLE